MSNKILPMAVYYEHPEWFRALFAELDRRGFPYVRVDASQHRYDTQKEDEEFALLFNRMSASAYLRGHGNAIFYTRNYLAHLERKGVRVINGADAFAIETSKALQLDLFDALGLPHPRTRIINHALQAPAAAEGLRFPVVVKPNIGGRGAGIVRYETMQSLARAARGGDLDLGIDSTALVQEFIPARGRHIQRVETLGGKYLYAIRISTDGESFNLCPAEICQVEAGGDDRSGASALGEMCLADAPRSGLKIEAFEPPAEVIADVERIARAAHLEMGGVEYLLDERDGQRMYYDINALSNFVADAPRILGFDPHARLADYLEEEARRCATVSGSLYSAAG